MADETKKNGAQNQQGSTKGASSQGQKNEKHASKEGVNQEKHAEHKKSMGAGCSSCGPCCGCGAD
jgi:hypothetical protein